MILAMAGFAFEDLFIKMLSAYFPISEVIMILGFTGSIVFLIIAIFQNAPIIHKDLLDKYVIMRTICELLGAVFFCYSNCLNASIIRFSYSSNNAIISHYWSSNIF